MYTNPLAALGFQHIKHYSILKSHLRLPLVYLKIVIRFNRKDLTQAPAELPCLLEKFNSYLWSQMEDKTLIEKKFRIAGLPVSYIRENSIPNGKGDSLRAYQSIVLNIEKFLEKPKVVYFHSSMCSESLKACCNIVKKSVEKGINSYAIDVPTFLDEVKKYFGEKGVSEKVRKAEQSDLLLLYFYGAEYTTQYSQDTLEALIMKRTAAGKVTIVNSFLDTKQYKSRYGKDVPGYVLEFLDEPLNKTLKNLIDELT